MSLSDLIRVDTHYTRSINMERDVDSLSVVDSYIPTTRALRTLNSMVEAFKADESPRAWSLVGPYGSGKSSFALFLTHLLSNPAEPATKSVIKKLRGADAKTARKLTALNRATSGYCVVLLTGSPESLAKRLIEALGQAAYEIWSNRRGRSPAIVERLWSIVERKEPPSTSEMVECIEELQDALARIGHNGLLIVIDELGKFLEYEARHYGSNDIYLLQALAEHALAWHETKLSLVVMLHQAFEQYARGLGESLRSEWAKVQGRFENIPFLESAEQVLRVVAAAIEQDLNESDKASVTFEAQKMASVLAKSKALPGTMDEATAAGLFARCYPLHPVSALLLPWLCQKIAQNERTLFSYLGSREAHGFQDSISCCQKVGDWIYPWEIYEYFILNQSAALSDHFTHRRWAEVITATERLGDVQDDEAHILKAVGLLNIIGAQGNFKASKDIVGLCLPRKAAVDRAIKSLSGKSIIQYRKFSAEYRVWQGSDFDLDAHVEEELEKLGRFGLAESLNRRHSLMPIIARKYSIQSEALRYFYPIFADAQTWHQLDENIAHARVVFYLAKSKDDEETFTQNILDPQATLDIRVLCLNSDQLREATAEVLALEGIQKTAQELNSDPVAQREFKDRYNAAVAKEEDLLDRLTSEPQLNRWCWKTKTLTVESKRSLQEELSRVLGSVYNKSPVFKNELINRDKISSQAAAARNKLLKAMLKKESEPELAIEKYPPEKAIYQAILRATGIHQRVNDHWQFVEPSKRDGYNVIPVWKCIEEFLTVTQKAPRPFTDLESVLREPPYGVKAGVLPILYFAAYLANQDETALFEEGRYVPYLTDDQLERFVRRPGDFSIQRFKLEGIRASIFKEYEHLLYGSKGGERSLLSIARPLAKFMGSLTDFARTTKRIPPTAQRVHRAFILAKSPQTLLFDQLPAACGLEKLDDKDPNKTNLKEFSNRLKDALRELREAYPALLDSMRILLAQAFNLDRHTPLGDLRVVLRGRLEGLDNYTVDVDGLRAFIRRVIKPTETDDEWFTNLLMFLGRKSARKWSDTDADAAEFRLSEFSRRLNDLEKLRVHYEGQKRQHGADFDVLLLRSIRKGKSEYDELVSIDANTRTAIQSVKAEMTKQLSELGDHELRLALLAELVDEFLAGQTLGKDVQQAAETGIDKPLEINKGEHHG